MTLNLPGTSSTVALQQTKHPSANSSSGCMASVRTTAKLGCIKGACMDGSAPVA